jgi:hypothetical protein
MSEANGVDCVKCEERTNIKNKGFAMLDEVFNEHGWTIAKNEFEFISYVKRGFELDSFDIEIDKTKIYVCIPIKNSRVKYEIVFTDYFSASEYVEMRFKDFIC